ncbi:MAG: discoidin domain-containing protein [Saccharofermentanales bacterium]
MIKKTIGIFSLVFAVIFMLLALSTAFGDRAGIVLPWTKAYAARFDVKAEEFANPGLEFRPYKMVHNLGGAWNFNKATTMDQKLDYLKEIGFGGIVTNVEWNSGYLQDDAAFDSLNKLLDGAKNRSLGTWLYDEYWYPSGYANQLTTKDHPEFEAIGASVISEYGTGKDPVSINIPARTQKIIGAVIYPISADGVMQSDKGQVIKFSLSGDKSVLTAAGLDGDWKISVFVQNPVFTDDELVADVSGQKRQPVNLLNRDAVERFIDMTYKKYKEKIPDFSNKIQAFFTDEPALNTTRFIDGVNTFQFPLIPWESTLADKFKAKFGYELLPKMSSLFAGDSDIDKLVRQNFYELVGDMFSENYTQQIQDWCEANGSELSGHYFFEENLAYQIPVYGDLFQVLCKSGFPGIDNLQLYPEEFIRGGLFGSAKLASSAARFRNISEVMVELCPVSDMDKFNANSHEYAMGAISQLYISGISHINSYYDPAGNSNEEAKIFNDYAGRMGYVLDGAVMNSGIGIFYSTKTGQQYFTPSMKQDLMDVTYGVTAAGSRTMDLAKRLSKAKLDFDFFNEEIIEKAIVKNGYLVSGSARYTVIIIPGTEVMPLKTMQKLDKFASRGGKLIFMDCLPSKSNVASESAEVIKIAQKYAKSMMYNSPVGNTPNIALNALVMATSLDSTSGIYLQSNITDGTPENSNYNGSWSGGTPCFIEIDLGSSKSFDTVVLYTQDTYEVKAYNLQYWKDDKWVTIAEVRDNAENTIFHNFGRIAAQKVRIEVLEGSASQATLARINELELYDSAAAGGSLNMIDQVREWSNFKLKVNEIDKTDKNKLMVSSYSKGNRKFNMIVNNATKSIDVKLEQKGVKSYKIYDPYTGKIYTTTGDKITINSFRALFAEPVK